MATESAKAAEEQESRAEGRLIVDTDPSGAEVFIGYASDDINALVGETPLEIPVPAGVYFLRIEKDGFDTAVAKVDVGPGGDGWMRIKLQRKGASRRKGWRIAGNALLWPGLVAAGTGIGLIFAGNKRGSFTLAKVGYGMAAAGVTMTVSGGIILGLTHKDIGMYNMPLAETAWEIPGRSAMVFVSKRF